MGTKYGPEDHKRAFELYRELGTFFAVSKQKGMPSRATLMRWASPEYNAKCSCGYHGWDELEKKIKKEVRARNWVSSETDEQDVSQPDLEKYVRADLEKLKINRAIEAQILKELANKSFEPPKTLMDAQKMLYEIWREDRVITGEPESIREIRGPLVVMMGDEDE